MIQGRNGTDGPDEQVEGLVASARVDNTRFDSSHRLPALSCQKSCGLPLPFIHVLRSLIAVKKHPFVLNFICICHVHFSVDALV